CDDGDSRILARPPLRDRRERRRRHARWKAKPAELAIHFEGGRPEMRPGADIDAAASVDDHEGADRVPVTRHCGSRAEPTLKVDGGGAEARAGGAERECVGSWRGGAVAEIAIGGEAAPVLAPAVEEIEHRRSANERHANVPDLETAPAFAQQSLYARAGVEAEGRATGEHHGIDALNCAVGLEQVGLAP